VVFTVFDKGGGIIEVVVLNTLPRAVDAFLNWSWAGLNGLSSRILEQNGSITFRADLPPGFDAAIEIGARKV
jgi:hypothetical protein